MVCNKCQTENRAGRLFCAECGARLRFPCLACGFSNEPDEKFCGGCGERLGPDTPADNSPERSTRSYTPRHLAEKILKSRSALEGENKQVTALFCDITNSTALAERIGPEAMHALMNRFFDLSLDRIHRYEGTINQFLGDGFMALFGAPIAHEDHARRAVFAALDIQQALQDAKDRETAALKVRIGLNTGAVVVGAIGSNLRMDYTAVGDSTHLAARLQQLARPGQILISETTHRLIDGYCRTRSAGSFSPKGLTGPFNVREVIAARTNRTRLDVASDQGLTPFVGRGYELQILDQCFEEVKNGRGQAVFIVGEPGIGKSRLLYEFRQSLGSNVTWLEGHSISYGKSIAFHPLIDLLKRSFRIEENDTGENIREKIGQAVAYLGEDLRSVLPYIYYLLAVDPGDSEVKNMDPQQRRGEIFDTLRRLALRAAEMEPQVVVFEDLHWMDQATEGYIRFFTDSIPAARILCIYTYRHGYKNPFEDRTFHTRMPLTTLSAGDSVQMAGRILATADLPRELQDLISTKAEGNPFFVEEVVKALRETGGIARDGDRWKLSRPGEDVLIPDTIQDVIMARIDHLADAPKRTLQLASVIGRRFTYRLLDRLDERHGQTDSCLLILKALELIYEKDLFPELAFMFKHALTQDVAYNSLLEKRRREIHNIIGQAVEELYADRITEYFEVLAYHFTRGHAWSKALGYVLKAAEKTAGSFANREAIDFYDQALNIAKHLRDKVDIPDLIAIHRAKAELYLVLNDFVQSRRESNQVLSLARQINDREKEGAALNELGYVSLWTHDFDRALDYARQAIAVGHAVDDKSVLAGGYFITADVEAITGRVNEAKEKIDQSLTLSRSVDNHLYRSFALGLLGHYKNWRGEYSTALQHLSEGMQIAREYNLLAPLFDNLFMYGITLVGNGDYDQALETLAQGLAFTKKVGDEVYHLRIMNSLGWLYIECGDLKRAIDLNHRSAEGARHRRDPEILANSELNLADAFLLQNDLPTAQENLEGVYRLVRKLATSDWMKWRYSTHLFASYGEFWLARGDLAKAGEYADRCLDIAGRTKSRKYQVRGWRLKGEIASARRQPDEAAGAFRTALKIARLIGNPTQLWKTHLAMGNHFDTRGHTELARSSFQASRQVIEQIRSGLQSPQLRESMKNFAHNCRAYMA